MSILGITGIFEKIYDKAKDLLRVSLATALDKDLDSIDIAKMSKGGLVSVLSAITETTTSETISCEGFNAVLAHIVITGKWKFDMVGSGKINGTFTKVKDNQDIEQTTGDMTESYAKLFIPAPDFIQIVGTKIEDGTATVYVQPMNV